MSTLCIDIGNTNIHSGLVVGQSVGQCINYRTQDLLDNDHEQFTEALTPLLNKCSGIAFCSVVPQALTELKALLAKIDRPQLALSNECCPGLNIAYPKPSEIGQDRLANAIAAQAYYGVPTIVIDMGTAVTFDIVSSAGYEGGIIAPGLKIMTQYLHEQTALLPELQESDLVNVKGAIGKSTVHAMKLGVSVGFSGMIQALLERVQKELTEREKTPATVLATGGSIANLTREWKFRSEFVEDLTLIGLAAAFERNQAPAS